MAERIPAHVREQQINALPNISFVRWVDGYKNSYSKAVCRCSVDGHEWAVNVNNIVNNATGCPKCTGHYRWTAEERIAQINAKPNVEFVRWDGVYRNNKSKAICRCALDGFEWQATVNDLIDRGGGCPHCSGKRRWTSEERITQINEIPNITFVRWAGRFRGNNSKAVCRCAVDGFEWSANVSNLVNIGDGCPQCAGNRRYTKDERMQQINALPNISFVRWVDGYKNSYSKAICKCATDGNEWPASIHDLVNGGRGCPVCGLAARADARRIPENEIVNKINELPNISFVRWFDNYRNASSKAVYRCAVDNHEWSASVGAVSRGVTGCPKCAQYGYQLAKPGTLYILRSECGSMVKIGISNNHEQRHGQLKRATPFDWHCIELLHSDDGGLIAEWEKELHSWTEQVEFKEPFDGSTEWRKWDNRLPRWIKRYRARLARYNKAP